MRFLTHAGVILQRDSKFLDILGLAADNPHGRTLFQWFTVFADAWFSSKVSTEAMKRGTENEWPAVEFVKIFPIVAAVYDVEVIGMVNHTHFACSPDAIALLQADCTVSSFLDGEGDTTCKEKSVLVGASRNQDESCGKHTPYHLMIESGR